MKLNIQQEALIAEFYFDRYIEELRRYCEQQLPGFTEYTLVEGRLIPRQATSTEKEES
jgi:hypothetical protein